MYLGGWVAWKVIIDGPVFQIRGLDFMPKIGEFEHRTTVLGHSSREWSCWNLARGLGQWPAPSRPQVAEEPKEELGDGCFVPFFVASTFLRVLMSEASGYPDSPNTEHIWNSSNWGLHYRGWACWLYKCVFIWHAFSSPLQAWGWARDMSTVHW